MQDFRPQRDARKKELEDELSKLQLTLRYDSRLCSCYINNQTSPEWTASKVAKECASMHWLHNFTDYQERCHVASTEESRKTYFHNGRHFADHMKRRVYPAIKDSILRENNGGPEICPWITTAEKDTRPTPTTEESQDRET